MCQSATTQHARASYESEIHTALIRCVGEQRLSHRVEELVLFARYAGRAARAYSATRSRTQVPEGAPAGVRESDVVMLRLLSYGLNYAEIGRHMNLAQARVKRRLPEVFALLGVEKPVQAVAAAYECGLLKPQSPA